MGYAFISYSSNQQQQLNQIREFLTSNGIAHWFAPDHIPIGSKYSEVIKQAIENASCVLFLLSDRSQNSTYCKLEIALALKLEKPIIPIQLEDVILNDAFSLYLSTSEFFPLPRKITTAKTTKLLNQLNLLCTDPGQTPPEPADPSYKLGWFKKGTWLQLFGWLWLIGGIKPFAALARICYPVPTPSGGNHPINYSNGPFIEKMGFRNGVMITVLLLVGLLMICYGFSLNRKKQGKTRLFFKQFSLCQMLLQISFTCIGVTLQPMFLHLEHYYSIGARIGNSIFSTAFILLLLTLVIWLCGRIRQLYRWCKHKK